MLLCSGELLMIWESPLVFYPHGPVLRGVSTGKEKKIRHRIEYKTQVLI